MTEKITLSVSDSLVSRIGRQHHIDGLRGVAIILVLFYHVGVPGFGFGYLGVDIFFVISGYLISLILFSNLNSDYRFVYKLFIINRLRRLLPTLLAVTLLTLPFAWSLLLPGQFKDFAQSIVTALTFTSNFLFWNETGYFEPSSFLKPMLHTWSLSVEFQLYLVYPFILTASVPYFKSNFDIAIIILAVVSYFLAFSGTVFSPDASFYLPITRFWEFAFGAIVALATDASKARRLRFYRLMLISVGMVALCLLLTAYLHEAILTLTVVFAASLIGYAGKSPLLNSALSFTPIRYLGAISYSIYLWHQPILTFFRLRSIDELASFQLTFVLLAIFFLSVFTYNVVERPFLKGNIHLSRTNIFFVSPVVILPTLCIFVFVLSFGLLGHFTSGFPSRFPKSILQYENMWQKDKVYAPSCYLSSGGGDITHPVKDCGSFQGSVGGLKVMLIGDSHAETIAPFLKAKFDSDGISFYGFSYSGCIGLVGFRRTDLSVDHRCSEYVSGMLDYARRESVNLIVIFARSSLYLSGVWPNNQVGGVERGGARSPSVDIIFDTRMPNILRPVSRSHEVPAKFKSALESLTRHHKVVFLDPIPEPGWDVPLVWAQELAFRDQRHRSSFPFSVYKQRNQSLFEIISSVESPNFIRLQSSLSFCEESSGACYLGKSGIPYYRDDDHLSVYGATLLVDDIYPLIREFMAR